MRKNSRVKTGLDVLAAENCKRLSKQRVALLANQASVSCDFRHVVEIFREAKVNLVKIFAPEHGFYGARQDMATVDNTTEAKAKVPVISLYGQGASSLAPSPEMLSDVDVVVCDLPDIGSRYYTFAQTIGYLMAVARGTGTKILVLDRPNPLGGNIVEGGNLQKSCRSFCGYAPVPNRHGLTMGELAELMNKGFGKGEDAVSKIDCQLEVIKIAGWEREMDFPETGLPWVLPSPNMPTFDTALVYPGMCLFEATNLSEGRGTTRPFELLGAPYVSPEEWIAETLNNSGLKLAGAILRPTIFEPQFQKFAKQTCYGVQIHVTDKKMFRPYRWGLALIAAAAKLFPKDFAWRTGAYEFVDNVPAIDLLFGSDKFRKSAEAGASLEEIERDLAKFENLFLSERKEFLLYT